MNEQHHCPKCDSPDTVSYWSIKSAPVASGSKQHTVDSMTSVLMNYYPDARKCVDCKAVWW